MVNLIDAENLNSNRLDFVQLFKSGIFIPYKITGSPLWVPNCLSSLTLQYLH